MHKNALFIEKLQKSLSAEGSAHRSG